MKRENAENKKNINKPLIISISAVAAVILLVVVLAVVALSGDGIAKGITVEGKNVAGMNVEQATEFIGQSVAKEVPEGEVTVHFRGADYVIDFREAVTGYDAAKTAQIAYDVGRNKNVFSNTFEKIGLLFKSRDIPLEPAVNEEYINTFIDEVSNKLENPKRDDYYFMDGDRLKLVFGNAGEFADMDALKLELYELMRNGRSGEITLEAVYAEPKAFDVDEIYDNIAKPPVNTYYEEIDGKKYIKSAENGYDFDKEELKKAIEQNRGKNTSFYFVPEIIKPQNTTLDETGLFTEELSRYTSKITDQDRNRLNNVHLAASKINGVIINPGDTFAYLSYVEPITVEGGYKTANVYANGKIEKDIGGGVCQVSSALYSAVLNANLEVVKRYAHSLTVGYVPLGQDATVSSGEIDFRFKNNTNEPIKIVAQSDNAGVYITLLGKKVDPSISVEIENVTSQVLYPETVVEVDENLQPGEEIVDYAGKTGYIIQTYKHIYKDGTLIETVHVSTSRYKKIDKTVRKGPDAVETGGEITEDKPLETVPPTDVVPSPEETVPEETAPQKPEGEAISRPEI